MSRYMVSTIASIRPSPSLEPLHDLLLAHPPVRDQGADMGVRPFDRRAVGGAIDRVVARQQQIEAFHIKGHVAVGGRHHGGRPAHDMIAGEQASGPLEREAEMVGGVARSRHRAQPPPVPFDRLAVGEDPVRRIIEIEGGVGARPVILERERGAADDRRAARRGERAARRAVVAMGVGAQDRSDPLACRGGEDRVDMVGQVRPGIDHRDLGAGTPTR